jgi:hypothetical protein
MWEVDTVREVSHAPVGVIRCSLSMRESVRNLAFGTRREGERVLGHRRRVGECARPVAGQYRSREPIRFADVPVIEREQRELRGRIELLLKRAARMIVNGLPPLCGFVDASELPVGEREPGPHLRFAVGLDPLLQKTFAERNGLGSPRRVGETRHEPHRSELMTWVAGCGQLDGGIEEVDAQGQCLPSKAVCRSDQPVDRAVIPRLCTRDDVSRHLHHAVIGRDEPRSDLLVDEAATGARDVFVDGGMHEIVTEGEAIPGFVEISRGQRRREIGQHIGYGAARDQREIVRIERRAEHRCGPQCLDRTRRKARESSQHHRSQARRNRGVADIGPALAYLDRAVVVQGR